MLWRAWRTLAAASWWTCICLLRISSRSEPMDCRGRQNATVRGSLALEDYCRMKRVQGNHKRLKIFQGGVHVQGGPMSVLTREWIKLKHWSVTLWMIYLIQTTISEETSRHCTIKTRGGQLLCNAKINKRHFNAKKNMGHFKDWEIKANTARSQMSYRFVGSCWMDQNQIVMSNNRLLSVSVCGGTSGDDRDKALLDRSDLIHQAHPRENIQTLEVYLRKQTWRSKLCRCYRDMMGLFDQKCWELIFVKCRNQQICTSVHSHRFTADYHFSANPNRWILIFLGAGIA